MNNKNRRPSARTRRTPEQLRALKARTRCLKFGQIGHWGAECREKHLTMTDSINLRLQRKCTSIPAIANRLHTLVQDEDDHTEYLEYTQDTEPETEPWQMQVDPSPFDSILESLRDTNESTETASHYKTNLISYESPSRT